MKLYPMPGHVFIEALDAQPRSSGIIAASGDTSSGRKGRIVAVADRRAGPGQAPMDAKVGQYALFEKHAADVFSVKGRTFFDVQEDKILAVTDDLKTIQSLTTP